MGPLNPLATDREFNGACLTLPKGVVRGRFVERPNRFLVIARIKRDIEMAHLADPGRLKELLLPRAELLLAPASGTRKTRWTVLLARTGPNWVCINSRIPNALTELGLLRHAFSRLPGYDSFRREPKHGAGRADFLLETERGPFWLEVKGCSLVEGGAGLFPDAPTERGRRHLRELTQIVQDGGAAGLLFVVGRVDANQLRPNANTDPDFARLLGEAKSAGVLLMAHNCIVSETSICLGAEIPVVTP